MRKTIDELLQAPYWVIDILPKQVPAGSPGQYFAIEEYFLDKPRLKEIKQKHINIVLKLNCYEDISIDEGQTWNPSPDELAQAMYDRWFYIMIGDGMILTEPDDTHLTFFNPSDRMLSLIRDIAASEGLFVWQPDEAVTDGL